MRWLLDLTALIRDYWVADRAYRASMRALRRDIHRRGRELAQARQGRNHA